MTVQTIIGDCRAVLPTLPAESVHCVVTSPPYYGLRDYGVDGQIGLEQTPDEYIAELVGVFREVRRVLRGDGTVWLNLGDSYANNPSSAVNRNGMSGSLNAGKTEFNCRVGTRGSQQRKALPTGIKPKDLLMIPARVALALQADGWWLRSEIIWSKPNPMPESVADRPTSAHEKIYLLAKGKWRARRIKLSNLSGQQNHLGENGWPKTEDMRAREFAVGLATAILECPQSQERFGLLTLDSQIWQERLSGFGGKFIGDMPSVNRMALNAARLLFADLSPKEFLGEIHSLGFTLRNSRQFRIGGVNAEFLLPPNINGYGETAIAIHHPGEISKFEFVHGDIIIETPSGCTYYFDADAVREAAAQDEFRPSFRGGAYVQNETFNNGNGGKSTDTGNIRIADATRNCRNVWTIATSPFPEAHFATFPPELAERCIKAGTSEKGCCYKCGAPWVRQTEHTKAVSKQTFRLNGDRNDAGRTQFVGAGNATTGWSSSCDCSPEVKPCTVLDPFGGAGTTGLVADRLQRNAILIELNPAYGDMAINRVRNDAPLFAQVAE